MTFTQALVVVFISVASSFYLTVQIVRVALDKYSTASLEMDLKVQNMIIDEFKKLANKNYDLRLEVVKLQEHAAKVAALHPELEFMKPSKNTQTESKVQKGEK